MTKTDLPSLPSTPAEAGEVRAPAFPLATGSVSGDMTDDPEYQAWVESMAKHCRCAHDCPCAGVLAGGLCDDIQDDERGSIFDTEEDV